MKKQQATDQVLRTSVAWTAITGVVILNADGWDRKNYEYSFKEELISKEEFNRRLSNSTTFSRMF